MSGKKNKRLLGVISIFLWAVILTIVLRSYLEKTGYTLPVFWIVILACAARLPRLVGLYECADQPSHKET